VVVLELDQSMLRLFVHCGQDIDIEDVEPPGMSRVVLGCRTRVAVLE